MASGWPPPKSKAYLLPATLSTFITSISLLLDAFSFHSPTKGSFDADNAPAAKQATSSNRRAHLSMESSLPFQYVQYGKRVTSDDQDFIKNTRRFFHVPVPMLSTIHFSPATTGRSLPEATFSSARSRSLSSLLSKRPSRYSQRRKSSARRSPLSELHSEQLETRLR